MKLVYFNRHKGKMEDEKICGDFFIRFLYQNAIGQGLCKILTYKVFSKVYGFFQNLPTSKQKIPKFIEDYNINMSEYYSGPFDNFNQFFIRKFNEGARSFDPSLGVLAAPVEGRYLAYQKIEGNKKYFIKGENLSYTQILKSEKWSEVFNEGPMIIARLCPVDYHRFHFPDSGQILDYYRCPGFFNSVNPKALKSKEDIFKTNERQVTILHTKNMGKLAYIEVGAMCVGKIVQTHDCNSPFKKGDEKGYFLFGASTVIIIGEKGKFKIDQDILEQSAKNIETFIKLGDKIASK